MGRGVNGQEGVARGKAGVGGRRRLKKTARGVGVRQLLRVLLCCAPLKSDTCAEPRCAAPRRAGIIPDEIVEPMPPVLRALRRRLTRWGILPRATEPDSAIINIYDDVGGWVLGGSMVGGGNG